MRDEEMRELVDVYENGLNEIGSILEDDSLSKSDKLDAIEAIVSGDDDVDTDSDDD